MSAEPQPELGDDEQPEKRTDWPEQLHGFVRAGAFLAPLVDSPLFVTIRAVDAENARSGARHRSYEQYDRIFAAAQDPRARCNGPITEPFLMGVMAKQLRVNAARNNGLSAWQFAQSEQRIRDLDAQEAERQKQVSAEAEKAAAAACFQTAVNKYAMDFRAREAARQMVRDEASQPSGPVGPQPMTRRGPDIPRQVTPIPLDSAEVAERERRRLAKEAQMRADRIAPADDTAYGGEYLDPEAQW